MTYEFFTGIGVDFIRKKWQDSGWNETGNADAVISSEKRTTLLFEIGWKVGFRIGGG